MRKAKGKTLSYRLQSTHACHCRRLCFSQSKFRMAHVQKARDPSDSERLENMGGNSSLCNQKKRGTLLLSLSLSLPLSSLILRLVLTHSSLNHPADHLHPLLSCLPPSFPQMPCLSPKFIDFPFLSWHVTNYY